MKDNQIAPTSAEPRIFLVSPVLHCVSMTALVYLRSSFGFGYLRPKSIFFAFSWAFTLYTIYAWIDGKAWCEYRAMLWFGIGAMTLYWFQLFMVFRGEWDETSAHDNFSGKPYIFTIVRREVSRPSQLEQGIRLWGEPTIAFVAALILRGFLGERHLSVWLEFTGLCLWFKEALNQWFRIRQRKRRRDILEDAEDVLEGQRSDHTPATELPKTTTRKVKVNRQRSREIF